MKKIDESNFIQEIIDQNESAMCYLIDEYAWILKTVIARNLSILPNFKEECLNDCLLAIWENISHYDSSKSEFKNWVAGIAKYKCIDYKRKYLKELNNLRIDDVELVDKTDIDEIIIKKEIEKEIDEMLTVLSDIDKKIFNKFYFEEKNAGKIAEELGFSEDTIYQKLSRGRNKIKKKFSWRYKNE